LKAPLLESVFLNRIPRPTERDLRRILVLGGDKGARDLAARLTQGGFEPLLVGDGEGTAAPDGASHLRDSSLEEVEGFVGGFHVTLRNSRGRFTENVGFIAAAQPGQFLPKYGDYGLNPSQRVISLSDLEKGLEVDGLPVSPREEWFHAAFLCGLEGGSDPALFARVLDAIAELRKRVRLQPYVFTRHVKVSACGLERRYREARVEGALFFKFDDAGPIMEDGPDGLKMVFTDPLLGIEMELAPDLLVVDERAQPPEALKPLLDAIPSSAIFSPFLQPESPRFTGLATPKAGVFALGPSRGNFSRDSIAGDIESVIVALKEWKEEPPSWRFPGPPEVDQARCTTCLTCVRLCPHGAMTFQKRAEADPLSCERCGICAVECPARAITLTPAAGEAETIVKIREGLVAAAGPIKIAAFLCSRSAAHAMQAADADVRRSLVPIVVSCAGSIDLAHILAAFELGADGVLAAGCHTGNCASLYGTVLAGERIAIARHILEEAGIDRTRLLFTTLASNTPGDFARAVRHLEESIQALSRKAP
jgi:coenzyme F420-reducing hydrogenase delta subunit/Pyruvate/2-oxoacid:ferredoxin oxidoreductase delta subunit